MTQQDPMDPDDMRPDDAASAAAALHEKLTDILTPGYAAEFDPGEAEMAGAFPEDALGLQDAAESCLDRVAPSTGGLGNAWAAS